MARKPTYEELEQKVTELEKRSRGVDIGQLCDVYTQSPIPTLILSKEGKIEYFNDAMAQLTGYVHEEVPDIAAWMHKIYPDEKYRNEVIEISSRSRHREVDVKRDEFIITTKNGERRYVQFSVFDILGDGGPTGLQVVQGEDVTNRKKVGEELQLHSEIVEHMAEGVYLIRTSDGVIVYANETFEDMFGYARGELVDKHVSIVNAPGEKSPEELAGEIIQSLNESGTWSGEIPNVKKDGTPFWCYANVSTFDDPKFGEVWISVHQDITLRKEAEKELRKHRDHLEELVQERTSELTKANEQLRKEIEEHERAEEEIKSLARFPGENPYPVLRITRDGTILYANEASIVVLNTWGCQVGQRLSDDWRELITDVVSVGVVKNAEFECEDHIFSLAFSPVTDSDYVNVYGLDVTDRKHSEGALRESEAFLNATGQIAKVGGWTIDGETKKVFWTKEIYNITETPNDYDPSALEKEAIAFFSPEDQLTLEKAIQRAFEHNEPYNMEFSITTAKGNKKWVQAICEPIVVDGKVVKLGGTFQDITERKQAEEQIKASLKEKGVLLQEVHHRVKNNMQVIISLLRLQADNIDDEKYADLLKESQDRIKSMALIHEKFYQAENFADIDFDEYVRSLSTELFRSYGADPNKIALKTQIENVSLMLDYAIPCGLIVNELVSNSLKYAFPEDRTGEIKVVFRSTDEDELDLTVSDNGIGLPKDLDIKNTESLGLHLVNVLGEYQLGGKLDVRRENGTEFHLQFKPKGYKARI